MSHSPLEYLRHVRVECEYLLDAVGGITSDRFLRDETLKRAVSRSSMIIGEAVWQMKERTPTILDDEPGIEWSKIVGLRHRLTHAYVDTDHTLLWNVCEQNVPPLLAAVRRLIDGSEPADPAAPASDESE